MSEDPELETQNRVMFAWSVIEHNSIWIQSADNKATASIAVNSLITGFLLTSATSLALDPTFASLLTSLNVIALSFLSVLVLSLFLSILFAFLCLTSRAGFWTSISRLLEPKLHRPNTSLIFFNSIVNINQFVYQTRLKDVSHDELLGDLAGQVYALAVVASQKHKWVNFSYLCLGLELLALICFGFVAML